jgi:hypothetical protein
MMWFLIGFLLGGRPSDSFWRSLMLMLAWALPLGFGKLVAVNVAVSLYVPASLAAYAAMIAFALYRPATSTVKLALIEGSIMWARLVAIVFGIGAIWNLSDAGFEFWRAEGVWRDLLWCGLAIGFEVAMRWWIQRDVVLRNVVFD